MDDEILVFDSTLLKQWSHKLEEQWLGPYKILWKGMIGVYSVDVGGKPKLMSGDQLKLYHHCVWCLLSWLRCINLGGYCDGVMFTMIQGIFVWFELVEYFLFCYTWKFCMWFHHDCRSCDPDRAAVSHHRGWVRVTRSWGLLFLCLPCFQVGISSLGCKHVPCDFCREMRDLCCYVSIYS